MMNKIMATSTKSCEAIYCRICSAMNATISLFCDDIVDKIKTCTGVEFQEKVNFSRLICEKCLQDLLQAYDFREKCLKADNFFISEILKVEFEKQDENLNFDFDTKCDIKVEPIEQTNEICNSYWEPLEPLSSNKSECMEKKPVKKYSRKLLKRKKEPNIKTLKIKREKKCKALPMKTNKKFFCENCQMEFSSRKDKLVHKKTHQDPLMCEICGKQYKFVASLIQHSNTHNSISYHCNDCDYKTNYKQDLVKHVVTHQGIKSYQCTTCLKYFMWKSNLLVHTRRVHQKMKRFFCDKCDKKFFDKKMLDRHVHTHTGFKQFKCEQCPKEFSQPRHWKNHLINQHNIQYVPKKPGRPKKEF